MILLDVLLYYIVFIPIMRESNVQIYTRKDGCTNSFANSAPGLKVQKQMQIFTRLYSYQYLNSHQEQTSAFRHYTQSHAFNNRSLK